MFKGIVPIRLCNENMNLQSFEQTPDY
jgi:hypothetical protein